MNSVDMSSWGMRTHRHMLIVVLTSVLLAMCATPPVAAAPPAPNFSGVVVDAKGGGLADPNCLYLWPKDATVDGGWSIDTPPPVSSVCNPLGDSGDFSIYVPPGDYKVQIEAANVVPGMFVGGLDIAKAKTFTVPATSALKGLVLKVDVMTRVSGKVTANNDRVLVNPSCIYFWVADKAAAGGFRQPDGCADIDVNGAFVTYLGPGTYRAQVQADNVADLAFAGPDATLKNATNIKVAATPVTNMNLKVTAQPMFAGRFTTADGFAPMNLDSLRIWILNSESPSRWVDSGDAWDFTSKGAFTSYLSPGAYRLQVVFSSGSSTFYGGNSIDAAQTITVPDVDLTGMTLRLGTAQAPASPTGLTVIPWDSSLQVSWAAATSSAPAYSIVTAQPSGALCATVGTTCTIKSLKNGAKYTLTLTQQSEGGVTTTAVGQWTPAIPTPRVVMDPVVVAPGGSSLMRISNVAAGTKLAITGTLGVASQNVVAGPSGTATASLTFPNAGISALKISGTGVKAATNVYIASLKVPATAKVGQAVSLTANGVPPGATVRFSAGSVTATGTAGSKGMVAVSVKLPKAGKYATSITVGSLTISGGTISAS